jgi:hypothetical protein
MSESYISKNYANTPSPWDNQNQQGPKSGNPYPPYRTAPPAPWDNTPYQGLPLGPAPAPGMVWKDFAFGGGEWVMPQPIRLSDEDVERIAHAVVRLLKAEGAAP